jgi:hypothetical protein
MSVRKRYLMVAAVFALASMAASAETIAFRYSGVVTYGGPMAVPAGTPITGTFSYDNETVPALAFTGYANYQIPVKFQMTGSFGSQKVVSNNMGVTVRNNAQSNVEDSVEVMGSAPVLDGTTLPNGVFGFILASGPGSTNVLKNTKLPKSYNVSKFDAGPSLNYGVLQSDGGQLGTLLQFSVDSIDVVRTGR